MSFRKICVKTLAFREVKLKNFHVNHQINQPDYRVFRFSFPKFSSNPLNWFPQKPDKLPQPPQRRVAMENSHLFSQPVGDFFGRSWSFRDVGLRYCDYQVVFAFFHSFSLLTLVKQSEKLLFMHFSQCCCALHAERMHCYVY